MKATIEFQLPEDRHEHLRAIYATEAWSVLYDIDNTLRNVLKHGDYRYKTVEDLATAIREQARIALDKIDE
jgi:aspartate aminotransferase-like enzyme